MNDDNYLYAMFGFINKFLDPNSCMVLFHKYKLHVVRKIKLFLENNNFKISWRWAIVNNLPCQSTNFKGKKVLFPFHWLSPIQFPNEFSYFNINNLILSCKLCWVELPSRFVNLKDSNSSLLVSICWKMGWKWRTTMSFTTFQLWAQWKGPGVGYFLGGDTRSTLPYCSSSSKLAFYQTLWLWKFKHSQVFHWYFHGLTFNPIFSY